VEEEKVKNSSPNQGVAKMAKNLKKIEVTAEPEVVLMGMQEAVLLLGMIEVPVEAEEAGKE